MCIIYIIYITIFILDVKPVAVCCGTHRLLTVWKQLPKEEETAIENMWHVLSEALVFNTTAHNGFIYVTKFFITRRK